MARQPEIANSFAFRSFPAGDRGAALGHRPEVAGGFGGRVRPRESSRSRGSQSEAVALELFTMLKMCYTYVVEIL